VTEFELIDLFTSGATRRGEGVLVGRGDDAAVLRAPRGLELVATVDAVVEGVHFDRRFAPDDVGWKALAVNLSDVAAMAARPLWALCALAVPPGEDPRRLAAIGAGLARCARAHRTALVGGNVTRARDLSLTVTVLGAVRPGRVLTRAGARPGDLVLVSGTLGDAALGLHLAGRRGAASRDGVAALVRRQRRPEPRVALGLALSGSPSAGLDISDGLLQDLGHLCAASGTGAVVHLERLPLSAAYRRLARGAPDGLDPALAGGEDYELVVAVPPARLARARRAAAVAGVPLTVVGEITPGRGVRVVDARGVRHRPRSLGHDHLRPRTSPAPGLDFGKATT
jgi:thiamine-monophosphate kinase